MTPLLVTVDQARARWGCGRSRLYVLIAEKKLVARKNGTRTLIEVASGDAFFSSLPRLGEAPTSTPDAPLRRCAKRPRR